MEQNACPTCGSCAGMFTANSMNCLMEVLGLALPYNGTALAVSDQRREMIRQTAFKLVENIKNDLKPRDIVTLKQLMMHLHLIWLWVVEQTRHAIR